MPGVPTLTSGKSVAPPINRAPGRTTPTPTRPFYYPSAYSVAISQERWRHPGFLPSPSPPNYSVRGPISRIAAHNKTNKITGDVVPPPPPAGVHVGLQRPAPPSNVTRRISLLVFSCSAGPQASKAENRRPRQWPASDKKYTTSTHQQASGNSASWPRLPKPGGHRDFHHSDITSLFAP